MTISPEDLEHLSSPGFILGSYDRPTTPSSRILDLRALGLGAPLEIRHADLLIQHQDGHGLGALFSFIPGSGLLGGLLGGGGGGGTQYLSVDVDRWKATVLADLQNLDRAVATAQQALASAASSGADLSSFQAQLDDMKASSTQVRSSVSATITPAPLPQNIGQTTSITQGLIAADQGIHDAIAQAGQVATAVRQAAQASAAATAATAASTKAAADAVAAQKASDSATVQGAIQQGRSLGAISPAQGLTVLNDVAVVAAAQRSGMLGALSAAVADLTAQQVAQAKTAQEQADARVAQQASQIASAEAARQETARSAGQSATDAATAQANIQFQIAQLTAQSARESAERQAAFDQQRLEFQQAFQEEQLALSLLPMLPPELQAQVIMKELGLTPAAPSGGGYAPPQQGGADLFQFSGEKSF